MRDDEGSRQFIAFVQELREQQGYTLEQVCEGICTPATIHSIETGNWKSDKLVRDYILDRLGAGTEDYEHLLDLEEYGRFEARHLIVHCIVRGEIGRAEGLLRKYRETYDMEHKLERQFCLCMEAQVRRLQGGGRREISALLEEAAALTIPGLHTKPLEDLALSSWELNLVLETLIYCRDGGRARQYRQVAEYIEKKQMDGLARAKIYPKAVCFLYHALWEETGGNAAEGELEELLRLCRQAVEILRDSGRMYYLWELLELEGRLVSALAARFELAGEQKRADGLREWRQKRDAWKQALEAVSMEYGGSCQEGRFGSGGEAGLGNSRKTMDFRYFYLEKGCYCINDVIRVRRKMLGIGRQELCEGICSDKTMQRLEKRKTKPQGAVAYGLLAKLGLPAEHTRTELMTSSSEARELMRQYRNCVDHGLREQAQELLGRIRELIPMDNKFNEQVLRNAELCHQLKTGTMEAGEYYREMLSVLELTVPFQAFLQEGEKYLTYEEQTCIQNLMMAMDKKSDDYRICMRRFEEMYRPYEEKGFVATVLNMYEFIMCNTASALGDLGEYDRSDRYSEIILRECMIWGRLEVVKSCLYNLWWNYDKRRSEGIPNNKVLDDREELQKCLAFAEMAKDAGRIRFYQDKLKQIEGK